MYISSGFLIGFLPVLIFVALTLVYFYQKYQNKVNTIQNQILKLITGAMIGLYLINLSAAIFVASLDESAYIITILLPFALGLFIFGCAILFIIYLAADDEFQITNKTTTKIKKLFNQITKRK